MNTSSNRELLAVGKNGAAWSEHTTFTDHGEDVRCQSYDMSVQRVTVDKAISPLLPRPFAPFDRTERKRAHTSAVFYSECFLRGIEPVVADKAAVEAQGIFDKWWIRSTACNETESHNKLKRSRRGEGTEGKQSKSIRSSDMQCSFADNLSVLSGPNVISVTSTSYCDATCTCTDNHENEKHRVDQSPPLEHISTLPTTINTKSNIELVKHHLIEDLRRSGGFVNTPEASTCFDILHAFHTMGGCRPLDPKELQGNWLTISKPTYTECLGKTEKGESLYSLGRIGFDMYKPTSLVCSVQASFNNVQPIDPKNPGRPMHVPRKLIQDIRKGGCQLHSYDIVVAVTIQGGQNRKGNKPSSSTKEYIVPRSIRGILTTQGYSIPDPEKVGRLSIWFSGGTLEVQDEVEDLDEWKRVFDTESAPDRAPKEFANILAARVLLGAHLSEKMEVDGTMSFSFKRPIGGHGSVYCDVLYMDDTLRIMKGHHGSVYVCIRVPDVS